MDHDLHYNEQELENPSQGPDWKKIVMFASFGVAAVLFFKGKRAAGIAAAGVGLAALASDHPEKLQELWERAPEYLEKGHRLVDSAQNLIDRVVEQGENWQSIRRGFQQHAEPRNTNSR